MNSKPECQHEAITHRSPSGLTPWPTNARTHSKKLLVKLKASIQKFGFTAPVLIDEKDVILSGHGRVEAAKELGLKSVPARVIAGLTEVQKRAYVLADNKIAQLSGWDNDILKSEMEILIQDDFNIDTTGFSTAEVDLMFGEEMGPESDSSDELSEIDVPEQVISQAGDLWQLDSHRLLCGNALDPESYGKLMKGVQAQMVITDPPYNVPIAGHVCGNGKPKHKEFAMASGEMSESEFTTFLSDVFSQIHDAMQDGGIFFSFMDWRHMTEMQAAAKPMFGSPRQLCVWCKDNGGMGTFYRSQHELIFVFRKGDAAHINNFELGQHGRYRTNVWNYPGVNTFKGKGYELLSMHPTVKPVAMIADAIRDCSHRSGLILDPFSGSGTILIAAERTGRHARAIELDPQYVDVSVKRWQRVTGNQAVLTSTGQTWDQLSSERLSKQEVPHGL
ncbi:DNA methyltransferase [Mariprofundus sp. KV]|uniref:site-specific DNA-methyltransferase n=1 Tax=Mariprofundus sp. KV TaxID=2608715 RepID=UPI00159FA83A|nr:DNA methyltransferase [Mariprofundus sp. KV]NWF35889.1 DNA methylase N-4 [Mariprofundus sp. KV]